ncbi:MAG: hypothetical protein RXN88_03535 [Acidilobus sp.]
MVRLRPLAVLASSRCLSAAASLESAPFEADPEVARAVEDAYKSLKSWAPPAGWDAARLSLWYAAVYGGLVLVYTCGPVTPISRVTVATGISIMPSDAPRRLEDMQLLSAWAKLWAGDELGGLRELEGGLSYPAGFRWKVGGDIKVSVRGIIY